MPVNQNKINEALSSVLVTDMDDVDAVVSMIQNLHAS